MLSRLFALRRLKPPGILVRIGVRSCGAMGGHVEKLGYYGPAYSLNPTIENLFAYGVVVVPHTTITDLFTLPGVVVTHEE